ncbi:MAG TPA: creatininase family protein [Gemmatimonadales bacterium]|nr:creatininase family protein [Gemmatimonadales bacterium]
MRTPVLLALTVAAAALPAAAQTNPLWREQKVTNYLPHMTWPEVRDLLTRTDMVIIPVASLEQHGHQLPIGTDYLNGLERAKLVAQRTAVLVAPILLPGQSPYHMEFAGTITISPTTMQQVYFEAAQSLIRHGFRRFLLLNSHAGNQYVTRFVMDRINQETPAIAVDLGDAVAAVRQAQPPSPAPTSAGPPTWDRHGGVGETSAGLYLMPTLVALDRSVRATLTYPPHMTRMVPQVVAGDPVATMVFMAEGLKPRETGKGTSAAQMSTTGVWSERDPAEATAAQGQRAAEAFVEGAVRFIERWKELRPYP